MKKLLTPEHVALLLGVTTKTVHALVKTGQIAFYHVGPDNGGLCRFSKKQVRDFLADCERRMMDTSDLPEPEVTAAAGPVQYRHFDLGDDEMSGEATKR